MNTKKMLERFNELFAGKAFQVRDLNRGLDLVDVVSGIREILLAGGEDEKQDGDISNKTINGSSLGWMLDQIRKQENRIGELEKSSCMHGNYIYNMTKGRSSALNSMTPNEEASILAQEFENGCKDAVEWAKKEYIGKPPFDKPSVPYKGSGHTGECKEGCQCAIGKISQPSVPEKQQDKKGFFKYRFTGKPPVQESENEKMSKDPTYVPNPEQTLEDEVRDLMIQEYAVSDEFVGKMASLLRSHKSPDTIEISREVAEEWADYIGNKRVPVGKENYRLFNAIKQALKEK